MEVTFTEEGREERFRGWLYVDDLVLGGKSNESLRVITGRFLEVC